MSTIDIPMSPEQYGQFLAEAITVAGEARLLADLRDADRTTPEHDRALMVQATLISLYNALGDGRPAPKLSRTTEGALS